MTPVNIALWDAESRRRFDRAIELANRFWAAAGETTSLKLENAERGELLFTDGGKTRRIVLVKGGLLMALANLPRARSALMFRGYFRVAPAKAEDPTVSPEAQNLLLVRGNGKRRGIDDLCGFLVHELTHVRQEARSVLGPFSFGLAYLATLGIPYEREADAAEERAEAFVRAARGPRD